MNLFKKLQEMPDFRRKQGRVHDLAIILSITVLAYMSGYFGIRAIGDFIQRNKSALLKVFKPNEGKLPSHQTVSRVLNHIDFDQLSKLCFDWAKDYIDLKTGEWMAVDGKVIAGTVTNPHNTKQNYTNLVSVFTHIGKQILAVDKVGKKESEIPSVRKLISCIQMDHIVFTMDALHCQTKTTQEIVQSHNDFVIGVKGNQKGLLEQVVANTVNGIERDSYSVCEKNRGRNEKRLVRVYDASRANIDPKWIGINSLIKVERVITFKGKQTQEMAYFISSLAPTISAKIFAHGIRNHWSIESSLHFIKDTTFSEDASKIRTKHAPQNLSLIRNIVINIFRKNKYTNMAQAIRLLSNDISSMWNLISA